MPALLAYLAVSFTGWLGGSNTYHAALVSSYISISILLWALLAQSVETSLLYRSILAATFIDSLVDIAVLTGHLVGWGTADAVELVMFIAALLYLIQREYDVESHPFNPNTVCLLFLKPRGTFDVIKAFFGFPVASICIAANGFVWAFRHKSGRFERVGYHRTWNTSHIIVDTGVLPTVDLVNELNRLVGHSRGTGCKCVWIIRNALAKMGSRYAPKWFEYVPGMYASKILKM